MCRKLWLASILVLSTYSASFGAATGGGFGAGGFGAALDGGTTVPGTMQMPTIPNNPNTPVTPNIPGSSQGIDFSGVDAIQRELNRNSNPENVDLTQGDAMLDSSQPNNTDTPVVQEGTTFNSEATAAEIDRYFDQILFSRSAGNPMRDIMRRLPRFGMSFFRRPPSTYAPEDNVPVTQDYRIGTGDEITLTLWGIPEEGNFRVIVNRDGIATIPRIGAVRLAGYTLQEAEKIIAARLNQYYTGYQMNLSMGRLRSIMVYVTGNAQRPGAYRSEDVIAGRQVSGR